MPGESERKLVEYIVQVFTDRLHGEVIFLPPISSFSLNLKFTLQTKSQKTPQWNFAVSFIKSQPETILSTMPGRVCELAHQLIVEADGASFLEHLLSRTLPSASNSYRFWIVAYIHFYAVKGFVKFGCHQTLFNAVLSGELPTSDPLNGLQFAYYTCIPQSERKYQTKPSQARFSSQIIT